MHQLHLTELHGEQIGPCAVLQSARYFANCVGPVHPSALANASRTTTSHRALLPTVPLNLWFCSPLIFEKSKRQMVGGCENVFPSLALEPAGQCNLSKR